MSERPHTTMQCCRAAHLTSAAADELLEAAAAYVMGAKPLGDACVMKAKRLMYAASTMVTPPGSPLEGGGPWA